MVRGIGTCWGEEWGRKKRGEGGRGRVGEGSGGLREEEER